jgi:hypothetical protein
MCHKATYAVQQKEALFDHLVGAGEQRRRDFEAKRASNLDLRDNLSIGSSCN